jgi:hypothetical protein
MELKDQGDPNTLSEYFDIDDEGLKKRIWIMVYLRANERIIGRK